MIKGKITKSTVVNGKLRVNLYEDESIPYWVDGFIDTPVGNVRKIRTELINRDKIDNIKVRWGINRYNYMVSPGIYAVGNPTEDSPVLVTGNFKLTFDNVRKELKDENLWILVLDTFGINVWCAAGKGTFGTKELINRINKVRLSGIISHKTVILPQLGATGVSAYQVKKATGFNVIYGPIRAEDIKKFLNDNMSATDEMREVRFDLKDRLVLTPIEFVLSMKYIPIIMSILFLFNLIIPGALNIPNVIYNTAYNFIPYLIALIIGTVAIPILLPYIPFRAFSIKGLIIGLIWSLITITVRKLFLFPEGILVTCANTLFLTVIISSLSLNFTGSTTYTSLSGVDKETRLSLPIYIAALALGLIFLVVYKVSVFIA